MSHGSESLEKLHEDLADLSDKEYARLRRYGTQLLLNGGIEIHEECVKYIDRERRYDNGISGFILDLIRKERGGRISPDEFILAFQREYSNYNDIMYKNYFGFGRSIEVILRWIPELSFDKSVLAPFPASYK